MSKAQHIGDVRALLEAGAAHHKAGRLGAAEAVYRRVLAARPGNANAHHLLAVVAQQRGDNDLAVELAGKAIAANPRNGTFRITLGGALQARGDVDAAIAAYRGAIARQPDLTKAHYNLGIALKTRGDLEAAVAALRRVVEINPNHAKAYNNLGVTLAEIGRTAEAEAAYGRALAIVPAFAEAHYNLGNLLLEGGRTDDAIAAYRRAADSNPDIPQVFNNLGLALKRRNENVEAAECYRRALALRDDLPEVHINLGDILQELGQAAESRAAYDEALRLKPNDAIRVRRATALPRIYESAADVDRARRRFESGIAELAASGLAIDDPFEEVRLTNFHLAYQGLDDRPVQQAIARLYIDACPTLEWNGVKPRRGRRDRIRVGFASRYFRDHAVALCFGGLINRLDRGRFEVAVLTVEDEPDDRTKRIRGDADRAVWLPKKLAESRRIVADLGLDALIYTDIGMDPLTYFLAYARLAPVQCALSGHPVTTGIPNVDYFVSADANEPADAADHYSETLARLVHGMLYYVPPGPPAEPRDRAHFGFAESDRLYACPQNVIKFHPDFDAVLGDILRRDPAGRLVLIESTNPAWGKLLARRLERTIPDVVDRVRWLPLLTFNDFLGLIAVSDVLLDPIHFGGGNTTRQSLAFDKPVVTLPGAFLRGRMAYGCYRRMGLDACIAKDTDDYVGIAVRLATDRNWRHAVERRIAASKAVIFRNRDAVREFEDFIAGAVAASHDG